MSKLQVYVLKEVIRALLPAFAVLLAVMMLGFGVQVLQEGLDIVHLHKLPLYMVEYCAPWVLPSALLTAVIMVFGRLAADKEILAMQVEGMHLWHVLRPVYYLAFALSIAGAYLHFERAPNARFRIESMESKALMHVLKDRILYAAGRRFVVSRYIVSYESLENGKLENVKIIQSGRGGVLESVIYAGGGMLQAHPERPGTLNLLLEECAIMQLADVELAGAGTTTARRAEFPMRVGSPPDETDKDIKHMTFRELRDKKRTLLDRIGDGKLYDNPGEISDRLSAEIRTLSSQRNELRSALDRVNRRLDNLESDAERDLEIMANRHGRLERLEGELQSLRDREAEYRETLRRLMDEKSDEELRRIIDQAETQKALSDIRDRISELKAEKDATARELEAFKAAEGVRNRNVERLKAERDGLSREIDKLSRECDELNTDKKAADLQDDLREVEIRFWRRFTLSFAALSFAVLGIPLGLLSQRHSTLLAFGIGFFIMLAVFYPFMVWGQIMAETGLILPVWLPMWMGNGVTFLIGAFITFVLFRR